MMWVHQLQASPQAIFAKRLPWGRIDRSRAVGWYRDKRTFHILCYLKIPTSGPTNKNKFASITLVATHASKFRVWMKRKDKVMHQSFILQVGVSTSQVSRLSSVERLSSYCLPCQFPCPSPGLGYWPEPLCQLSSPYAGPAPCLLSPSKLGFTPGTLLPPGYADGGAWP